MADMKRVHDFAVKWCGKFRDQNITYIELFDHYMADECAALGFEMDCGQAFSEKYGNAASDFEALNRIINDVIDIPLLGSAIYSQWRYFNHWAYDGEEILESNNCSWFILALSRLAVLSGENPRNIILFPDYEELKKDIEKLRTELSMLVLERDDLQYVECKNIEMVYMLLVGGLEYKAYEAQCAVLRLKRKVEMIQAKINRQETVALSEIDHMLDEEFAEYQNELNAQMEKMNDAIKRSKGKFLTEEETRELKKRYRRIVKSLHPDLHSELSSAQLKLFENAVAAYKNGDLETLRIIDEMVSEPMLPKAEEAVMAHLAKEKERLISLLQLLKERIAKIKSEYPYTVKELIGDQEKIDARKAEIEELLCEYEALIKVYSEKIKEMLG